MTIAVVGSHAAMVHRPALWQRPVDLDLVSHYESFCRLVRARGIPVAPVARNRFVGKWHGKMLEVEIAWAGSTAADLLGAAREPCKVNAIPMRLPSLDWLFTLKASHRFKKDDIHFDKTMRDYHRMRKMGLEIVDARWLERRERETYTAHRPRLNVTKAQFFANSDDYLYDHDSLHRAVAHLDRPAYEYYKADREEVRCSRESWLMCEPIVRLYGVLEEAYVLALERSQIHFGDQISPRDSFLIALRKVCTSITSGWFRAYAYDHYFDVLEMYSDTYVTKFRDALARGIVSKNRRNSQ